MESRRDGGYDGGYEACDSLWGSEPSSLVRKFCASHACDGMRVLDLGCGEGKNSVFLAQLGASVDAVDCSAAALSNAKKLWDLSVYERITWNLADAVNYVAGAAAESYDLVVLYGLLHCLSSPDEARQLVQSCQRATTTGGANIVCTFNDRSQDLSAHPGFDPLLLPHSLYVDSYVGAGWAADASDSDLHETHPHNEIPHHHSMTRIIATRRA